jgi:16S rRNA (guanine(966)-N(2))-methyltransferase RsmD
MESKLQIISGKYRGRKLALPANARPTQNKARIALFNMLTGLGVRDSGFVVWDAFAGSGAFGIEWLSRYENANVIFTDISADSFKTVNKNIQSLIPTPQSRFIVEMTDAINAIKRHGATADLIFIDPPYADADLAAAFVRKLTPVAKPGAILVWETEAEPSFPDGWDVLKYKQYGRARFLILQRM